ncbi:nicotinate-nucleotide adenylyltransferase [Paenibacillus filicis]|uniref:Probable nicotinate-nucleotide adenylyltransferase n=1 Tax=Paenibacillus gyeongsangnamensis TaxID=3388067 RepID=A0ABT4Q339_9BACL|nr:nicotinate-nucleotide adenylyltransferase [Paenibacillus filicis]MCZ8511120.1 nicotinate-nucleotide adenylyltransferase [Paenibacillus filicis]
MKVGLMGGTFDPIHIGHLIAAQCALEAAGLDEVWFMPTNVPPHKKQLPGATPEQRWEMVNAAVEGHPAFRAIDVELRKGGVSYSVDTVKLLMQLYPGHRFHYIVGADMVQYLPKWYKIEELANLVVFIGLSRPGYGTEEEALPEPIRDSVRMARMPLIEISSTEIRKRLAEGRPVRYLVPDRVNQYIEVNRLYES